MLFDELFEKMNLSDEQVKLLEATLDNFKIEEVIEKYKTLINDYLESLLNKYDEEFDGEYTEHFEECNEELAALSELQDNIEILVNMSKSLKWDNNKFYNF